METAARGDEADTRLKEMTPDLVVLDWMMPGLSGIELCRGNGTYSTFGQH